MNGSCNVKGTEPAQTQSSDRIFTLLGLKRL